MSDYFSTTRAERLTIAKIVDPSIFDIDTASKMLYRLWDDNFGMREQKSISAEEAEDIGNDIRAIHNLLYGAISEYNFAMGRYEELCLQNFTERATRILKTAEAERAFDAAIEAGCHEAVKKARDLDNDAAIAILNAAIANKEAAI